MNSFSISQLEQFSGIKAHTIRIWEQRYNALKPNRSEGNTRSYDGLQLKRLLNIVSLMGQEFKVAELCQMPDKKLLEVLEKKLNEQPQSKDISEYLVSQLISAGLSYDTAHFEKIFSNCLLRYGLQDAYKKVIYPLILRIGWMWADNTMPVANEHFISNLIRNKFISAIEILAPSKPSAETWMLFLPEGEFHELGLLMSHYVISKSGRRVVYLGSNLSQEALFYAANEVLPSHLLFFLVHNETQLNLLNYLNSIKRNFGDSKICLTVNDQLKDKIKATEGIIWIRTIEELEKLLIGNVV